MNPEYVFSSESTTVGHPDKLCDQISDAIVDAWLRQDPSARVVAECAISTGIVFVSVKHASTAAVDVPNLARDVIRQAGYAGPGFDARGCTVMTALQDLGPAARLDARALAGGDLDAIAAADQATVFGFACRDSPALMPLHAGHETHRP
jgi:S-adenosylmethionine synthetase